jgi:VanZ family protein
MASEVSGKGRRGLISAYAPVFLWIAVIFYLSSDSGSMTQTSRFLRPLVLFFFPDISEASLQIIHGFVRKSAHVVEYAVLALLVLRAMWTSHFEVLRRYKFVIPVLFVIAIASIDEFNQSFLSSRTGTARDVLLDTAGGITAVLAVWLCTRFRRGD